jgi:hypothetical protein
MDRLRPFPFLWVWLSPFLAVCLYEATDSSFTFFNSDDAGSLYLRIVCGLLGNYTMLQPINHNLKLFKFASTTTYYYYYYYYYCSTALCWALAAFSVSWSYTQAVGLLRRGISPSQGLYLHTEQHKHRINTQYRHPCLKWDSNPRSQLSSERTQFMP